MRAGTPPFPCRGETSLSFPSLLDGSLILSVSLLLSLALSLFLSIFLSLTQLFGPLFTLFSLALSLTPSHRASLKNTALADTCSFDVLHMYARTRRAAVELDEWKKKQGTTKLIVDTTSRKIVIKSVEREARSNDEFIAIGRQRVAQ